MKIDFVSDVVCPWCAIGLAGLLQALDRLGPQAAGIDLRVRAFELNPDLPAEGEPIDEHLQRKYGLDASQLARNREALRARGAAVDVTFAMDARSRIHNTFHAHRLLHWAGTVDPKAQLALKRTLLHAYFAEGRNPSDPAVLRASAAAAGLDAAGAEAVIADPTRFAQEVREEEAFYTSNGIHAVPSVIVDDRHLIQGGQPPEAYEQALRQLLAAGAPSAVPAGR